MKKLFIVLLLSPLFCEAQNLASLENDTLHSNGGYMIYKGQTLHFAKGTSAAGYFRHVKFHTSMGRNDTYTLQNSSLLVNSIRNFKRTGENYTIRLGGIATLADGRKTAVDLILDVENAITADGAMTAELTVPAEYSKRRSSGNETVPAVKQQEITSTQQVHAPADLRKLLVADEIKKLFDLFKAGALTKEEFESQKKKLLERQ